MIKSKTTGKLYNPDKMVFIVNPKQIAKYMDNEAVVYDFFSSRDSIVVAFSKEDTKDLYDKWCKHEL